MGDKKAAEQRKARLAKALRENLRKRKARGAPIIEGGAAEDSGSKPHLVKPHVHKLDASAPHGGKLARTDS